MWERVFESETFPKKLSVNGDGGQSLEAFSGTISLQHPWISGAPVYAPDHWAPTYDYPLICYLHDDGRSEHDLWRWFPGISDQNFLGVGVRAPFPAQSSMPGQFRWRGQRPDATHAVLCEAIEYVQEEWNVHPDRIVLFGEGHGAVAALQQFMLNQLRRDHQGLRFGGAICRNLPTWWARVLPPLEEFVTGRVLLLDPIAGESGGEISAAIDGLNEAGISVTLTEDRAAAPTHLINHWMMSGILTTVF